MRKPKPRHRRITNGHVRQLANGLQRVVNSGAKVQESLNKLQAALDRMKRDLEKLAKPILKLETRAETLNALTGEKTSAAPKARGGERSEHDFDCCDNDPCVCAS